MTSKGCSKEIMFCLSLNMHEESARQRQRDESRRREEYAHMPRVAPTGTPRPGVYGRREPLKGKLRSSWAQATRPSSYRGGHFNLEGHPMALKGRDTSKLVFFLEPLLTVV